MVHEFSYYNCTTDREAIKKKEALEPLSGALAAGNAVVVKPSELAPSTTAFLAANIPRYMDADAVKVILGAPEVEEKLMERRWDQVIFTGK